MREGRKREGRKLVIGLDFDNTLADYDRLLSELAVAAGWLEETDEPVSKREIRDHVRAQPDGEQRWRRLQATAYGVEIHRATPLPGTLEFLERARRAGAKLYVISHKTERAAADPDGVHLHEAARSWLEANGFFEPPVELGREGVFFEPDRPSKLRRIATLGCTHFVDDLEETFLDPAFPPGVERLLLLPAGGDTAAPETSVCRSWDEIAERILGV